MVSSPLRLPVAPRGGPVVTAVPVTVPVPLPRSPQHAPTATVGPRLGRPTSVRREAVDLAGGGPAYNEAQRLPDTVAATMGYLAGRPWTSRIVVVDNGSSDGTACVIRSLADRSSRVSVDVIGCSRPG